ncbi:MAG TPA: DUF2726 domain-containing protein [Candidatus Acidoferrales bacterium]|nr:DUF2726 domain-containing protein [Candidatus Acidoferrales bacterium]
MIRRKRILVNDDEKKSFELLDESLRHRNVRLYTKVRIADALDINNSGLSNEEYSFALKGHFDFLVEPNDQPVAFAIEFDEPYHDSDPKAQHNDELKNLICEKLDLPLLRIQIDQLQQVGKFTILGWLVELWFLYQGFIEAQESGLVPFDEPFDYSSIITSTDSQGKTEWYPYDPFRHYRDLLTKLVMSDVASACGSMRIPSQSGYDECFVNITLSDSGVIIGRARCRTFSFPPLASYELAEELAVRDACIKYSQYKDDRFKPITLQEAEALYQSYEKQYSSPLVGFSMSKGGHTNIDDFFNAHNKGRRASN